MGSLKFSLRHQVPAAGGAAVCPGSLQGLGQPPVVLTGPWGLSWLPSAHNLLWVTLLEIKAPGVAQEAASPSDARSFPAKWWEGQLPRRMGEQMATGQAGNCCAEAMLAKFTQVVVKAV